MLREKPAALSRKSRRPRIVILIALPLLLIIAGALVYFLVLRDRRAPTNRDAVGQVTRLAGAGHPGGEDGQNRQASFSDPFGVAVDSEGSIFVADGGDSNRIRRITPQGVVETAVGSEEGFADGAAREAKFNTPSAIAIDDDDNLYIADTGNNRIRKLDSKGQVTTVAGTGAAGFADGAAREAIFDAPIGVAVDEDGNVYVADTYNDRIRKISKDGQVTTIAGTGVPGYKDGTVSEAQFDTPCGIAVDKQGNIFVADTGNDAVRKITVQGEVMTVAGSVTRSGDESVAAQHLDRPLGLALTHDGFLFVACEGNGRIYRIAPDGQVALYAGSSSGYADGTGEGARLNGISGIAVDADSNLYVADTGNYLLRKITPVSPQSPVAAQGGEDKFIQPDDNANLPAKTGAEKLEGSVPNLSLSVLKFNTPFPYPLAPQNKWHEVAGTVGEARGSFNGEALHHLHSGLDFAGQMGEACLSVMDEKVSSPISTWGHDSTGEGIGVGLMSYIHIKVGRNSKDEIQVAEKFKPRFGETGKLIGVRVRRGTRFRVGDFLGTLNRLYHVHMNLGPWNAPANALQFPFAEFRDTVPPVVEPEGIEFTDLNGQPFKEKINGRVVITGDVKVIVTAYDQVDGNRKSRKLGLYRAGYQLLNDDGTLVKGYEVPLVNIEFNRLPPGDDAVKTVYAEGSGVSAYGTPTKFRYIVTNRVRDGEARQGLLRTSSLAPGNYLLKVIAEDYSSNRATGKAVELAFAVR